MNKRQVRQLIGEKISTWHANSIQPRLVRLERFMDNTDHWLKTLECRIDDGAPDLVQEVANLRRWTGKIAASVDDQGTLIAGCIETDQRHHDRLSSIDADITTLVIDCSGVDEKVAGRLDVLEGAMRRNISPANLIRVEPGGEQDFVGTEVAVPMASAGGFTVTGRADGLTFAGEGKDIVEAHRALSLSLLNMIRAMHNERRTSNG